LPICLWGYRVTVEARDSVATFMLQPSLYSPIDLTGIKTVIEAG
jgi:hypothetical protein